MGSAVTKDEVLEFWYRESTPAQWFRKDKHFDSQIRDRFEELVDQALRGEHDDWAENNEGALALIIVLDQFTRNIFRDSARAYSGDALALELSQRIVAGGTWTQLDPSQKHFLLIPMMHSEDLNVQDAALPLFQEHTPHDVYDSALRHRDIIARFGRFPHRNGVLGRDSTDEEEAFLRTPGSSF